jgi:hypothetical protein
MTITHRPSDELSAPPGATVVDEWQMEPEDRTWNRLIKFREWDLNVADAEVKIIGTEWADGTIERGICLSLDEMTASAARAVSAALLEAATYLESLEAGDRSKVVAQRLATLDNEKGK